MPRIVVTIERVVDDAFPTWVEWVLVDAGGQAHHFRDKLPIVWTADMPPRTFPAQGSIRCVVVAEGSRAKDVVGVDTMRPDGLQSLEGNSRFDVLVSSLLEP